jgi:hypothetical protein
MAEFDFTPEQIAELRRGLGVPDGEPDPTADDLAIVCFAEAYVAAVARWLGLP